MSDRPNIVLINCDDLGYGDLGCYGSEVNRTPALDRMAEEGVRFTDFYMAAPVCSPSRGAMMTGCYPRRIGFGSFDGRVVLFPGQPYGLNPEEVTVASLLNGAGYATKIIGKWHCGDQSEFLPTRHGFDSYYGIPYSNDMGRQRPGDTYPPLPLLRDEDVVQQQPDQTALTERYVEEGGPFHSRQPVPALLPVLRAHVRPSAHLRAGTVPAGVGERRLRRCGGMRRLGGRGPAPRAAEAGLDEKTLVIFTSDNGSRAASDGGEQRSPPRHEGDYVGGRHEVAVHHALARQDTRRLRLRRGRHGHGPIPYPGGAGRRVGPR